MLEPGGSLGLWLAFLSQAQTTSSDFLAAQEIANLPLLVSSYTAKLITLD